MSKKQWFWIILVIAIVGILAFFKITPFYTSLSTVVAFVGGGIVGWWLKMMYDKYIKKEE